MLARSVSVNGQRYDFGLGEWVEDKSAKFTKREKMPRNQAGALAWMKGWSSSHFGNLTFNAWMAREKWGWSVKECAWTHPNGAKVDERSLALCKGPYERYELMFGAVEEYARNGKWWRNESDKTVEIVRGKLPGFQGIDLEKFIVDPIGAVEFLGVPVVPMKEGSFWK